jgi:hypothetical protein
MCREGTLQGDVVSAPVVKSLESLKIASSAQDSRSPIFGISLAHIDTEVAHKRTEGADEPY